MKSARKPFYLLTGTLVAALAASSFLSPGLRAADTLNKEEVQKIVREYLVANPEVVIEAIEAYQANQVEIEARRFKETITGKEAQLYGKDLPFAGNPNGDVVVVEFFDYNCGYCKRAIGDVQKVIEKDPNVKFVFREMPILSEASQVAARYALAAHKQGKYFDYHQKLMTGGARDTASFEAIGKELGLDVEKLRKDADSKEVRAEIEKSLALSQELGIRGTPAFIIGSTLAPGYMTSDAMLEAIAQAREGKEG